MQQLTKPIVIEHPGFCYLVKQRQDGRFNACGLIFIDMISVLHGVNRAFPRVRVLQAPKHVIQQSFTQCAIADIHTLDREIAEYFGENRHASRQDRQAIDAKTG